MARRSWHTRRIGLLAPCGSIAAAAAACCSLRHQYNVGHWAHSTVGVARRWLALPNNYSHPNYFERYPLHD